MAARRAYITKLRGAPQATVLSYVSQVRPFVIRYAADGGIGSLTARQITDFVTDRATGQSSRSAAVGANALRSLLRWMWDEGLIPSPLADAVGKFAAPVAAGPPRALSRDEMVAMLAALPTGGAVRLRNEAMLALMWRLGLRAGEVASLRLEDINWRVGILIVRGKGCRIDEVPLPVDVGKLLAAYLRRARPSGRVHRQVFLSLDAPHQPVQAAAVTSVAGRILALASVPGSGAAHRLRHTAACGVLAAGGGLAEVGQLLRHSSPQASAVYAKSDNATLSLLARQWPIGASQ